MAEMQHVQNTDSDDETEDLQIFSFFLQLAALASEKPRGPPIRRQRLVWSEFKRQRVEDGSFRRMFRVTDHQFDQLVSILKPFLQVDEGQAGRSTDAGSISVQLRVALTLRFLAGGSYLDLFHLFGIGISTFYQCKDQVIAAINKAPELKLQLPTTESECQALAHGFEAASAYGAFKVRALHDCTAHISSLKPLVRLFVNCRCPTVVCRGHRRHTDQDTGTAQQ